MQKSLLAALLGATALVACGKNSAPAEGEVSVSQSKAYSAAEIEAESKRLNEWFAARWQEGLDFSPLTKTYLGIRDDDAGEIDDFSEAGADAQLDWQRDAVADLKKSFDRAKLTPDAQMSYDLFIYELEQSERALPFRRRGYVFHQMSGPHSSLPNFLINFHKVETAEDMRNYVSRIEQSGRALRQALERAKLASAEGVKAPYFAYDGVKQQATALITGAPFGGEGDAPLYADAKSKIAALEESGELDGVGADEALEAVEMALTEHFKPAYDELIAWVDEERAAVTESAAGVGAGPDGVAFYNERLAYSTTTDLTADEVHEIGLSEVARIRGEMEEIKEKVGFEGTLAEFFAFVRDDDQFYYPNTDEGREAYLQAARDHLEVIKTQLPDFFGILPKADLVVKRVEAFRERDGGAQHYFSGTPDGSRPGIFYAHLSDMKSMPIPQLEVIAYHEGNPGHHMQRSIAQEMEGLPDFRAQASFTAFTEGWALYSEPLAKEMGAYEYPYSDFGRLTTEIWRAIRLVVDTGLHAKGWSEQEAIDYFTANSPAAAGQIKSEVQRYLVMPGQATSYKIGMLKIQELRARAEAALGDDFDIRAFHDLVLGGGALPLSLLETSVDAWIAQQKSAA